ncbi:MAG: hypothetical protein IJH91_02805 [Mogibacterium sp.]|nr:hypothetical protein [Mogibacterium sp.]
MADLFTILQWTWGFPQTAVGAALYLLNHDKRHFNYHGACVTTWESIECVSLGKFIFIHERAPYLLPHEYGHSIQSLILGPLYFPLIGLPSAIWNRSPHLQRARRQRGISYYAAPFERTANTLAHILGVKPEE